MLRAHTGLQDQPMPCADSTSKRSSVENVASKSRQAWDPSTRLDRVFLHASSTGSATISTDSTAITARRAAFVADDLKSVTLQNNSACLTQCPVGYKLNAEQLRYPRANTPVEKALAIAAMLAFFSVGALLPFLLAGCLAAALIYQSIPAMLVLAITALDWFLPPGKVN
jgi:hypothetical protein